MSQKSTERDLLSDAPSFEELSEAYEEFAAAQSNSDFKLLPSEEQSTSEPNQSIPQERLDKGAKIVQQLVDGASSLGQKDVSVFVGKKKVDPGMPFTITFWDKILESTLKYDLQRRDLLVLMKYATILEFGNKIIVSQKEISDALKISPPHVSASVKKLITAGLLIKDGSKLLMNWHCIAKGNLNGFKKSEAKAKLSDLKPSTVKIDEVNVDTLNIYMDKAPADSSKDTEQKGSEDLPF